MSKAIKFLRQLVIKNYNNLLGISLTLYILKINKKRKEKKKAMSSIFAPGTAKQECSLLINIMTKFILL